MRGRKPIPTSLKLLRGNPGKRPLHANEPTPPALDVNTPPPAWLDKPARVEWRRLAPLLAEAGLLTALDVDSLAAYCVAVVHWRSANAQIVRHGMVTKTPTGHLRPSPYLKISDRAFATMHALLGDFGMSPASRARVTRSTPPPTSGDPLQKFLKRGPDVSA